MGHSRPKTGPFLQEIKDKVTVCRLAFSIVINSGRQVGLQKVDFCTKGGLRKRAC